MTLVRALIFVALALTPALAGAQVTEIFKCKDEKGRWTYTNDRRQAERQKCQVVASQVNTQSANKPVTGSTRPSQFPRESAAERAQAKGRQRQVLEKELVAEQEALAKARQELATQESVRNGDEGNYARVLERLQPMKDNIETHEKNIEALRRELNALR